MSLPRIYCPENILKASSLKQLLMHIDISFIISAININDKANILFKLDPWPSLVNSSCLSYLSNRCPWSKLTVYSFSVFIYPKREKSVVAAFLVSWCISSPESRCTWSWDFLTPSLPPGEETVERWGKWSDKGVFMGFWVPRKWSKSTTPPPAGKI